MRCHWVWALAAAVVCSFIGCDDLTIGTPSPAPRAKKVVQKKVLTRKPSPAKKVDVRDELEIIDKAFRESQSTAAQTGSPEEVAVGRVTQELERFVEVGPTLVVWLVDRTSSAGPLVQGALPAIERYYQSERVRDWSADGNQLLLTAVAAVDDQVELLLDPPSADPQGVREALGKISPSSTGKELLFSAIKQVLKRYESIRSEPRQIVLVLVSDEAGDDGALVDELALTLQKQIIPLYAIGYAAPWGQANPFHGGVSRGAKSDAQENAGSDAWPSHGPESLLSERVHLPLPAGGYGFRSAEFDDLVESGFGPFGIERLCRAGGGAFLAVRPMGGSFARFGGVQAWPTGAEAQFEPSAVFRYAPDYLAAADYQKLLAESKARQALTEAAKIGRADILDSPNLSFAKVANEAQMKRQLDAAQQESARVAPQIDRLYEVLLAGEADREQLTGPRWQAQFDYAFGRVLAAKARNDGYNQMIAALKAGKGPKDAANYVLEPADQFETSSALKKMAEKAKVYLERVVKEHPGTPWARFAEEDLKVPMGWKWQGS